MFRRIRTLLCLLSLILCLATGWFWWRSYGWYTIVTYGKSNGEAVTFFHDMGGLYVGTQTKFRGSTHNRAAVEGWSAHNFRNDLPLSFFEADVDAVPQRWKPVRVLSGFNTDYKIWFIVVPHWFLMLLLGIWPAIRGWRWICRRKRFDAGCCRVCGYDLCATPGRCPECGHTPAGGSIQS